MAAQKEEFETLMTQQDINFLAPLTDRSGGY